MLEISVVILIVGILILGLSKGIDMYNDTKLVKAKKLTRDSIVGRLPNLLVWLETTLESSFDKNEAINDGSITTWKDTIPSSVVKNNATQSNNSYKPKYTINSINGLPALKFDGVDDWMTLGSIGGMESNSEITIFVVFRATSTNNRFLIAKQDNQIDGKGWNINSSSGFFLAGHQSTNFLSASPSENIVNQNIIVAISYNGSLNNNNIDIYRNGKKLSLITRSGGPLTLSPSPNGSEDLRIGAREQNAILWFQGLIGEIIIFQSKLSSQNIDEVNKYLMNKWL